MQSFDRSSTGVLHAFRKLLFPLLLGLMVSLGAQAATPSASPLAWSQLTPQQREALGPLQPEWPHFNLDRKRKWLNIASRYSAMSPDQRATLHRRMTEWVRMTPEQRRLARENFLATGKAPLDSRKEAWERYQKLSEARKRELAREARTPPHRPGHVGLYESEQRLKRQAVPRPTRAPTPTSGLAPMPSSAPKAQATGKP